jgi:L-ascorbate metabolism protein UlaG (beta-lactamase superfamily)
MCLAFNEKLGGAAMLPGILDNISWFGHDGFMIKADGKIVIIDPYQVTAAVPADIILISHAHYDHCSPADIGKLQTSSTVIITEPESARQLSGDVRIVKPGDVIDVAGFKIEAVPAYNTNKKFHPRKKNWLGFILTIAGCRIYHAGDTDLIDEMEDLDVDIALLPVSGTYVMTAAEAVEAAKRIKPRVAIPMHYDSLVGSEADAYTFAKGLQGTCEVKILKRT